MEDKAHKTHHAAQSGTKAEKKAKSKGKGKVDHGKGYNDKAFAPKSGRKADRQGRRTAEKDQTRLHVPLVNRTPEDEPPPVIVAIVGPLGVGKTTLVKSLVRRYTKHTLSEVKGPITVVAGKKRRLTFVECNNDLNSMIDIGKIADLVLLMIDGSFGFEMETFEFLNILQAHGFPKVIGVLTHLDLIKKLSTQRETKKQLKKRFWTEIYQGAKLFYLSGVLNGRYPDSEIQNLSRFISVMKFRPLVFRNSHPYVLADRLQDLTSRELVRTTPSVDRTVTLYGYLRGTNLRETTKVHIPGAGDLSIKSITRLADPCPLPTSDSEKRRKLSEKQKLIHAPMSDVGGVMYDKDAVYINVPGNFTRKGEGGEEVGGQGEGEMMVMDLQDVTHTLADKLSQSHIRLLGTSTAPLEITGESEDEDDWADDDNEDEEVNEDEGVNDSDAEEEDDGSEDDEVGTGDFGDRGRTAPRQPRSLKLPTSTSKSHEVEYAESDSDLGDGLLDEQSGDEAGLEFGDEHGSDDDLEGGSEDEAPRWKSDLAGRASRSFDLRTKSKRRKDWSKLVYGSEYTPHEVVFGKNADTDNGQLAEDEDELFTIKRPAESTVEVFDQTKEPIDLESLAVWEDEEMLDSIRHLFITGEPKPNSAQEEHGDPYEDDAEGGFEDLEAPTNGVPKDEETRAAELAAKKEALKRKFDEQYDDPDEDPTADMDFYEQKKDEMARQLALNRAEFEGIDEETRVMVEGHRAGAYVRIELENVPCELVEHFDPGFPIIVGGLLPAEERFGFIQVRIKRHRWYTRTLKTNDPLIFSVGWRRFQSLPIYSLDDHSIRMRMLKYTPEHMHCYATFYGPVSLPGTGFCAFNSLDSKVPGFRVSASGVVLDIDRSVKIVKKLKLTGTPYKIFKNTAFIKDMFNSALEVAKFEGANIRTVSGIRGQIKKAQAKPDGAFRATFEDKVLMSDIVFLRAWYSILPRKFYNPVTSLLLADKEEWTGMRLTGQVRRAEGLKTPLSVNSTYKAVDRPSRRFNPLKIPRKLQADLPYASKTKITRPQSRPTYTQKRAVVLEPEERKAISLIQQIRALRKDQVARRREKQGERKAAHRKKIQVTESKKEDKKREERKEYMRLAGQKAKRASEGGGGRSSKRSRHD
ncbi:unnamed protein product [Rhizoctonia solani]|uniref:Bms1-type G domain-containing protein n=1 Tax=Rhizoctonia solani TaxID=456999 RepID=A0A8H3GEI0_9AGAM|nr:unnamed protein product [Rhizoctonia solani]